MIDYPLAFYVSPQTMAAGLPERLDADWTGKGSWDYALHMISLALRERGVPCRTTSEIPTEGVMIAHPHAVGFDFRPPKNVCFICYQGDWPRCVWAEAHIVINRYQLTGPNLTFADKLCGAGPLLHLPFIPEPSLIPRDPGRGDLFENIAYLGTPYNLLSELCTAEWKTELKSIGLKFVVEGDVAKHADYSSIDCIVAIRPKDRNPDQKPPNKLWNAWRAGVPAILGPEAGFREQRLSPLDYIECNCAREVFDCLKSLKMDPEKVRLMRESGWKRTHECSTDAICQPWMDALVGPIRKLFLEFHSFKISTLARNTARSLRARIRKARPVVRR